MLEIKCPYCGKRSQNEFSYGGDASVTRPKLGKEISDQEWNEFIYLRKNPRGKHSEFWHHVSGCRQWLKVLRCTATHEIFKTAKIDEEL
jgi:heterotetrameric sarcosine oxidase delta subunit